MTQLLPICLRVAQVAIVSMALGACTLTVSQLAQPAKAQPVYKKEVIIATGYANISAQSAASPAQQRLMAIRASKLDAYRTLTEQVYGQNINASTTMEDMVVASDTLRSHVEGIIYGARIISITPIGDDSYETKLELEVDTLQELRSVFLAAS